MGVGNPAIGWDFVSDERKVSAIDEAGCVIDVCYLLADRGGGLSVRVRYVRT